MREEFDALVVGAGTAGTCFATMLARQGYSVAVLEKDPRDRVGARLDIFHFDRIRFAEFGVPAPEPASEELIATHADCRTISPGGGIVKTAEFETCVMRLPLFLARLHAMAVEAGVRIVDRCAFREPLIEDGRLAGVKALLEGEETVFRARLTADASGTASALRASLPASLGVETFKLGPSDVLHVILRYIRWAEPKALHYRGLNVWPYYKVFCNPCYSEEEAILGVGQPGSYAEADSVLEEFLGKVPFPPYRVTRIEKGITPYRRPPFSLVGEGFICLGDAACITKPFSGEGVTAAWTLSSLAAETAGRVLKQGRAPSREDLWEINARYFRGQGAKFAGLLAQIPGAAGVKAEEMEYLFEKDIIFNGRDISAVTRDYELKPSPWEVARMAGWLGWGAATRRFSLRGLRDLLSSVAVSDRVARHYRAFPEAPAGFPAWSERAAVLWSSAGITG